MNAAQRAKDATSNGGPIRAGAAPKGGPDHTHNNAPDEERGQFSPKNLLIPRPLLGDYRPQRPEAYDDFFATVLGDEGPFSIFATTPDGGTRRVEWAHTSNEVRPIVESLDGWNVWFGVGRRREILPNGQRGGDDDVVSIHALWVDIDIAGPNHKTTKPLPKDIDEAERLLERLPWAPSAINFTGGGFQAYWFLDEPLEGDEAAVLLDRFGNYAQNRADELGWHLDNVFDRSRVLRTPGSTNWKDGARPRRCELVDFHPERRYSAADLLDEIPFEEAPEPLSTIAPREPYVGEERPGDHFARVTPPGAVLEAAGWRHVRTDRNGDEHWQHPAATNASSATVFSSDGKVCVWTDSIPHIDARRSLDSFSVYTKLFHDDDASVAASALRDLGYGAKTADTVTAESPEPSRLRARLVTGEAVLALPEPEPIVAGLIYRNTFAMLYGAPKAGKSFLAMSMALSIGVGRDWLGHRTRRGKVLYVMGEGTGGLAKRVQAWVAHYNEDRDALDAVSWLTMPVQLFADQRTGLIHPSVLELAEVARELAVDMIVIDTLARNALGADENSARDAGLIVASVDYLKDAIAGCVLVVHHAGKDGTKGARGSSAFLGAVDTSLEASYADGVGSIEIRAQKDAEIVGPIGYRLHPVGRSVIPVPTLIVPDRVADTQTGLVRALAESDPGTGLPFSRWLEAAGASKSTFARHVKWLLDHGHVVNVGTEKRPMYRAAVRPKAAE